MCAVWLHSGGQVRGRDAGDGGAGRVQHGGRAGALHARVGRAVPRRRQPRLGRRQHRRRPLHRRARAALATGHLALGLSFILITQSITFSSKLYFEVVT